MTIVNPAALEPSLRDAVCEQCHLIGRSAASCRLDRRDDDYRPGLPFHRFWSVFEPPRDRPRIGSSARSSRCTRAVASAPARAGSAASPATIRIGCPRPRSRWPITGIAAWSATPIGAAACRRRSGWQRSRDDDCIGCHMPRLESSDILHVAATNHRIPRQAGVRTIGPRSTPGRRVPRRERPLVLFHRDLMDERERAEAERDIGVALCRDGPQVAAVALPLLEAALAARPDDVVAWEAKGFALGQLGRCEEGAGGLPRRPWPGNRTGNPRWSVRRDPRRPGGRRDDAIAYWRRAIAINPWRSDYRAELAPLCFRPRDWPAAAAACREALRLKPGRPRDQEDSSSAAAPPRKTREAARQEFQTLLGFDPPDREELIRRFATLSQPR